MPRSVAHSHAEASSQSAAHLQPWQTTNSSCPRSESQHARWNKRNRRRRSAETIIGKALLPRQIHRSNSILEKIRSKPSQHSVHRSNHHAPSANFTVPSVPHAARQPTNSNVSTPTATRISSAVPPPPSSIVKHSPQKSLASHPRKSRHAASHVTHILRLLTQVMTSSWSKLYSTRNWPFASNSNKPCCRFPRRSHRSARSRSFLA